MRGERQCTLLLQAVQPEENNLATRSARFHGIETLVGPSARARLNRKNRIPIVTQIAPPGVSDWYWPIALRVVIHVSASGTPSVASTFARSLRSCSQ